MISILLGIIQTILIIFLIGLFIRLVLNRFNSFKTKKRLPKVIITAFSTILIYLAGIFFIFSIITKIPKIEFNEALWLTQKESRYKMIDELIEEKILIGKNKSAIKAIISEPTEVAENNNKWVYKMYGRT